MKSNEKKTRELFYGMNKPEEVEWELPDLRSVKKIALDFETDGLKVFTGSKTVGFAITVFDEALTSWYIPYRHKRGFNYDVDKIRLWAKDNLRDKEIHNINTKFDLAIGRADGFDFEDYGCEFGDIAFDAALTNSKRQSYRLDDIGIALTGEGKVQLQGTTPIHERYSEEIRTYATTDTSLVVKCHNIFTKQLEAEDLIPVRKLEYSLIPVIVHMEMNGALIDVDRLEQFRLRADQKLSEIFWRLYRESGFRVEPSKTVSVAKLCSKLGIKLPKVGQRKDGTFSDADSVTNDWLMKQQHPLLNLVYQHRKISDLKSDYLDKYPNCIDSTNRIRYNLNQLKADDTGTVTGRMSSSGSRAKAVGDDEEERKINVQQVIKVKKDDPLLGEFPIRELFIPNSDRKWVSADASQLQFRVFAHYSQDPVLIQEYKNNPLADFHQLVADKILGGRMSRADAKHENFGNLFGMGAQKGADRLGVSLEEYKVIKQIYNTRFPAARELADKAQSLARHPSMGPNPKNGMVGRGYVKSISKRRRRYSPGENLNSAMNAVIQGTEADLVKAKLREVYDNRKWLELEMFFTVHDELDGDMPEDVAENKVAALEELLNDHSIYNELFGVNIEVPILWSVDMGDSWNL